MTIFYSTELAGIASQPVVKPTVSAYGGRLRRYRASITLASQTATDTIILAKIPAGSIFAFGVMTTDTSLGSSTVSIGITGTVAKYRALAVFTATDTPTFFGKAAAIGQAALTAEESIFLTIAVATLPSSGLLVIDHFFVNA